MTTNERLHPASSRGPQAQETSIRRSMEFNADSSSLFFRMFLVLRTQLEASWATLRTLWLFFFKLQWALNSMFKTERYLPSLRTCVIAAVAFAIGCGGPKGQLVQTVPVTGKVLVGDQPLSGAAVLLTPIQGTKGTGGFGVTDAEGKFSASIDHKKPGVEPGTYAVTFTKWAQKDGSPIPAGKDAADVEAVQFISEAYSNPGIDPPMNVITVPKTGGEFDLKLPAAAQLSPNN